MADRYDHPEGVKAQDIELSGNKLKKKGILAKRRRTLAEAGEGVRGGRRRQPGTSGYMRPKESVYKDLDKADPDYEPPIPKIVR